MITTNTTKQFLPKGMIMLEGASNWDAWDYKLLACASRDKIDYIRTEPDPNLDAVRVTVPLTEPEESAAKMAQIFEIQTQWDDYYLQNGFGQAPRVDPLDPRLPDISGATREENNGERNTRCLKYTEDVGKFWSIIVASVSEEPLAVVRQADAKDGKGAYEKLQARYEAMTSSTCVALIKRCFDVVQTGSIAAHVTLWLDLMRKLKASDLGFNDTMECVMFLRTLKPIFKSFKEAQFMKAELVPKDLYRDVIDFNTSCIDGDDEANTSNVALEARDRRPPNTTCPKFGKECTFLQRGGCYHKAESEGGGGGGGGSGGSRGTKRRFSDDRDRQRCYRGMRCTRPNCHFNHPPGFKGGGGGGDNAGRGKHQQKVQHQATALKAVQKTAADRASKLESVKQAIIRDGADPKDFGFVATCRSPREVNQCLVAAEPTPKTVAFTFDTGANRHFAKNDVALHDVVEDGSLVGIADGTDIKIEQKGTMKGVFAGTDIKFAVETKQSSGFAANLFSGLQAVQDGYRVVLDAESSYMERGNSRIPLRRAANGWYVDLDVDAGADRALNGAVTQP